MEAGSVSKDWVTLRRFSQRSDSACTLWDGSESIELVPENRVTAGTDPPHHFLVTAEIWQRDSNMLTVLSDVSITPSVNTHCSQDSDTCIQSSHRLQHVMLYTGEEYQCAASFYKYTLCSYVSTVGGAVPSRAPWECSCSSEFTWTLGWRSYRCYSAGVRGLESRWATGFVNEHNQTIGCKHINRCSLYPNYKPYKQQVRFMFALYLCWITIINKDHICFYFKMQLNKNIF